MNPCCPHARPRFFNWITVLLVTGWVVLVAAVAEFTERAPADAALDPAAFVERLVSDS